LNSSTTKRAIDLQEQLDQTALEKADLLAELESLREASTAAAAAAAIVVPGGSSDSPKLTLQLNLTEARTEVALLQRGVDLESAHSLAVSSIKVAILTHHDPQ